MAESTLRRAVFGNLFLNLALVLGVMQVLVWHWWRVVLLGEPGPGMASILGVGALLVTVNGCVFPSLRRHRRRKDWRGVLARAYQDLGVTTLLVGLAVIGTWLLFLVPAGLVGAIGGSPDAAFGAFRVVSVASVGSVALLLLWGFTGGQAAVARTRIPVELAGLARELDGLRIVQISDLHIGNALEGGKLERMVERVNAEDADVLVITGDIFDFDPAFIEDGARILAGLEARHGVYAILGNHDVYTGSEEIAEAFSRLAPAIRLLRDECVRLPLSAPLYLAGAEDPGRDWSSRSLELPALEHLARERAQDGPTLLLVHRPAAFEQAARLGFPLVLAGHTHGGQLALPLPGGHWNLSRVVGAHTRGLYRNGGTTLYVNRGIGVGGPAVRVNCPREITTIELRARGRPGPDPA